MNSSFVQGSSSWDLLYKSYMMLRQFVRNIAVATKAAERGPYAILNDAHIKDFRAILNNDENRVLTDEDAVKPYNQDWLKTQEGKCEESSK